jgi:hypothetical protein
MERQEIRLKRELQRKVVHATPPADSRRLLHSAKRGSIAINDRVLDTIPGDRVDDNLLIPLFAGFNAQILTYIISLGYLSSLPLV